MKITSSFFITIVTLLVLNGCASNYAKLEAQRPIIDEEIQPAYARIVFAKSRFVQNKNEIKSDTTQFLDRKISKSAGFLVPGFLMPTILPPDLTHTYTLFEYKNNIFEPIEDFEHARLGTPSFYIDVPEGKHVFVLARTHMWYPNFIGNMAVLNITVENGKTYPIIFGQKDGWTFKKSGFGEIIMNYYQLKDEDIQFIYDLRKKDISGIEREKTIANATDKSLKFKMAAQAIALMEKSKGPSDAFVKWTKKKADVIKKDFEDPKNCVLSETPILVY